MSKQKELQAGLESALTDRRTDRDRYTDRQSDSYLLVYGRFNEPLHVNVLNQGSVS